MTGNLTLAGQLLSMALASGLNLYATVAVLGLASRLGWITAMPPGLRGLEDPVVITSAALLFLVEFVIDKVPHLDSLWNTLHTFIRPTAAALLVLAATDGMPGPLRAAAAALACTAALAAHGTKAGLRLAINATPNRAVTASVSLTEDAVAIALAVAALAYPDAAFGIAAAALVLVLLFGPRLWRAFVFGIRALAARVRGFFGRTGWREPTEMPRALRAMIEPPAIGGAAPRAARATISAPWPIGAHRNGWLVATGDGTVFLYRSLFGTRRFTLPATRELRVRRGVWADAVELRTDRFHCTVLALKDGPPVELLFPDLATTTP